MNILNSENKYFDFAIFEYIFTIETIFELF